MVYQKLHSRLAEKYNLAILVPGLIVWPVATYAAYLLLHSYHLFGL